MTLKITVNDWKSLSKIFTYPYKKRKITDFCVSDGKLESITFEVKEFE